MKRLRDAWIQKKQFQAVVHVRGKAEPMHLYQINVSVHALADSSAVYMTEHKGYGGSHHWRDTTKAAETVPNMV